MEIKVFYTMVAVFLIAGGVFLGGLWFLDVEFKKENSALTTETTTAGSALGVETTSQSNPTLNKSNNIKSSKIDADKLYSLINAYRRDHKLSTLKAHLLLERSAQMKIADMEENKYWAHKDPKGRDSWYMFEQVGYQFERAGENLAFGYVSPWTVFEEWQKSPEHNAQMLTPDYEHMGLGIDCANYSIGSKESCVVVLHLGRQLL